MQSYALRPSNETTVGRAGTAALLHRTQASRPLRASRKRGGGTCRRWQCRGPHRPVLEGRHAGHRKTFGNHVRHVCSSQAGGRFGEERQGSRGHQNAPGATCNARVLHRTGPGRCLACTPKAPERLRSRRGSPGRAAGTCSSAGTGSRGSGGLFDASVNAARIG